MQKIKYCFLTTVLSLVLMSSYAQTDKKISILQDIVKRTHQTIRDVATKSGVPYTASATWVDDVYIEKGDSLVAVPFDSLTSPRWNYLEYDIKIVFDKFTNHSTRYLQGIIVLERIDPIREEKLRKRMLEDLKAKQEKPQ
ncbi:MULTISPECIES: hypothetical protein [unclassified Sphingobacterium]|uniref:hypothetical protein n=1 Tax=unclassified Sphingobacterium TaxID=2609468 RepID=UPI00104579F6|nr:MULTISPECIES: hypothetical protein [unclassified Sphingobacterium]MCS3552706.1 hypothetical protein [Sphingobacterium sp. JUb21]TCR10536.1 hypothetical protein EDF66_101350 [Sphingobacterium sp. JUb20]